MLYMPGIFGEDLMDRWFDDMDREFARMEKEAALRSQREEPDEDGCAGAR